MLRRVFPLSFCSILLAGCVRSRSVGLPPDVGAYASVARDSALLVFPSDPSQSAWPINLDEEDAGAEDYHWIVTIPHRPKTRLVWFAVNHKKGQRRSIASLAEFVAQAHPTAGRAEEGPFVSTLDSIQLGVIAVRGRLAIVVRGRTSVAELFDQRPPVVTFVRHTRGQPSAFDSVAVMYR